MLIFIDLAHLFMRQGHCLSTHHSAKLAVIPPYAMGPGNSWRMPPSPPIHLSKHLLTLATFQDQSSSCQCKPSTGTPGEGGALCLGGGIPVRNPLCEACEQQTATADILSPRQRCRPCKLLCLHAALTILTQMRSDNRGCSLINNIKMEGVS